MKMPRSHYSAHEAYKKNRKSLIKSHVTSRKTCFPPLRLTEIHLLASRNCELSNFQWLFLVKVTFRDASVIME